MVLLVGATACTTRLVDFTTLSSKNVRLNMDKGPRVRASDCGPFGWGTNIKTAVDRAIESSGNPQGDMLIDGVVTSSNYLILWQCYGVEGSIVETRNARPVDKGPP
jgi:hypothetical protein